MEKIKNITVAPNLAVLRSDLYVVALLNGPGNDRGLHLVYTWGKATARKEALEEAGQTSMGLRGMCNPKTWEADHGGVCTCFQMSGQLPLA